jgi:hypothetical protein
LSAISAPERMDIVIGTVEKWHARKPTLYKSEARPVASCLHHRKDAANWLDFVTIPNPNPSAQYLKILER